MAKRRVNNASVIVSEWSDRKDYLESLNPSSFKINEEDLLLLDQVFFSNKDSLKELFEFMLSGKLSLSDVENFVQGKIIMRYDESIQTIMSLSVKIKASLEKDELLKSIANTDENNIKKRL